MFRLGDWLARKDANCTKQKAEASDELKRCGIEVSFLREEWEAQKAAQTKPLQRKWCVPFGVTIRF